MKSIFLWGGMAAIELFPHIWDFVEERTQNMAILGIFCQCWWIYYSTTLPKLMASSECLRVIIMGCVWSPESDNSLQVWSSCYDLIGNLLQCSECPHDLYLVATRLPTFLYLNLHVFQNENDIPLSEIWTSRIAMCFPCKELICFVLVKAMRC